MLEKWPMHRCLLPKGSRLVGDAIFKTHGFTLYGLFVFVAGPIKILLNPPGAHATEVGNLALPYDRT